MSAAIRDKARSYVDAGKIKEADTSRVFLVRGSGKWPYIVTLTGALSSCNCPAGRRLEACAHVCAARMLVHAEADARNAA